MNLDTTQTDLTIHVDRGEVRRYLGYGRRGYPSEKIEAQIEVCWNRAMTLLQPKGLFRVVSAETLVASQMPNPTPTVGVGLATIGPGLDAAVKAASDNGMLLEAVLLDAIGSAAAEAAAEALDALVCAEASRKGLFGARRISPGYGKWNVTAQSVLLGLLGPEQIGVRLTSGLMMIPRKSVSFAVCFLDEPKKGKWLHQRCRECGHKTCLYRAEPTPGNAN